MKGYEDVMKKVIADEIIFYIKGKKSSYKNVHVFVGNPYIMVLDEEDNLHIIHSKYFVELVLSGASKDFTLENNLIATKAEMQRIKQMKKFIPKPNDGW